MNLIHALIDFILHIDVHLHTLILSLGAWTYVLLFGIIFVETGLVFMPFLPGDSLLFAAGSFAALGSLHIGILIPSLILAAILGDSLNYMIGRRFGPRIARLKIGKHQLLKPEHLDSTEQFFQKYGDKAIIIARFVPIVRTGIPFVAGIGKMHYEKFLLYNVVGGVLWITSLTLAGYFFGQIPWVKENFEKVVLAIIALSVVPIIWEVLIHKFKKNKTPDQGRDDLPHPRPQH